MMRGKGRPLNGGSHDHPSRPPGNVDFECFGISLVLSMTQPFAGITASQLRAAVTLKERILALEKELASVLGAVPPSPALVARLFAFPAADLSW